MHGGEWVRTVTVPLISEQTTITANTVIDDESGRLTGAENDLYNIFSGRGFRLYQEQVTPVQI